ncbi:ABC transporter-like [Macleaya cordata]|uniref:ABC transporter-like n=1 Tax=Macleaya cordata TaxID=56857 RepID=A0A200Q9W8_MACCD|nr:ABC transporter-like [Macleaya cordata]
MASSRTDLLEQLHHMVDVELPKVEVRYKNLCVDAVCEKVQGKAIPTLWNSFKNLFSKGSAMSALRFTYCVFVFFRFLLFCRMTLLLGPPGCGKTTYLLALAGKLNQSVEITGEISYHGYKLEEFIPQKTAAYISQNDLHIPEMTVRETLDFSAHCQGVGSRTEMMMEVLRREKETGTVPELDIDAYMKAISIEGLDRTLQTDYILKILGLDVCAEMLVGDALRRGISGGQKKRLTTGEMIVGPTKALLMDEISTGLDSSTTFQIVSCLQQFVHITNATVVVSLLQPASETFDLFDDIILMAEGKIIYHGPRCHVLEFFEHCGFRCPERKGVADFLQEVISEKDQEQYWSRTEQSYSYVTVDQFYKTFKEYMIGQKLEEELSEAYEKSLSHKDAISFDIYSVAKWELFKACLARELLLMKRNLFVYLFKFAQLFIVALITMTVFLRTRMKVDAVHADYYMGSLFYSLTRIMTNGIAELPMTFSRIPVFYKQRDVYFYPTWAYSIPASILKLPISLVESFMWTALTYYVIGYSPEFERFCRQFLILFGLHQASTSLFRFLASVYKSEVAATTTSNLCLLIMFLFSGFIIPRSSLPAWLNWGFWLSPMAYGEIGLSINEFQAPRWQKVILENTTIGHETLTSRSLEFAGYFYWKSVGALFAFTLFFNIGITLALTYSKPPQMTRVLISHEKICQLKGREDRGSNKHLKNKLASTTSTIPIEEARKTRKMVLPFEPLAMTFRDVQYFVDTPKEMRKEGFTPEKLQLLGGITGAFRPGTLTALMGISGAGKTTLMDVLSGRKSTGIIKGDLKIGGYPKVQETFARISGYCEQNDIHSPQITVAESVIYSAWLRLPPQIDSDTRAEFVREVLETIELDGIKDALVGIPGVSGLSTEQRKRLTIAVELVANPSIIFMDEPTSSLDARAAAVVMRAVRNVVDRGRTVVCTIHQPSIDIFEAFDELILMKRGGQIIYSGLLGEHSSKLIEYFECIPGLPKIENNYNPATWMLEVTSVHIEAKLGIDFAHLYRMSPLYQESEELVEQLSKPPTGSRQLHFPSSFPRNWLGQFKACLWKLNLSYWRSPTYNLTRLMFTTIVAVLFGLLWWQKGKKINDEQDLFSIAGSMFLAIMFLGLNNCSTVLPCVGTERTVLYRERFAGMYSSWAYSAAQVAIEIPYALIQAFVYVIITYPAMGYYWSAYKFFWYFYAIFSTMLYFIYLGLLVMSLSPNVRVASICVTACYTLLNLFSGYLLPAPQIPKWWIWFYWICPSAWSFKGLITSQYGDMNKEIMVLGEPKALDSFLQDYYGYNHDDLGVMAAVLHAIPFVFASLFGFFIAKLNFQRR